MVLMVTDVEASTGPDGPSSKFLLRKRCERVVVLEGLSNRGHTLRPQIVSGYNSANDK